ncbi:MAG: UvrD-helicase domain-containing protein [Clostridia bacterium]|nr:UvrD-helicase domain-containing protein [Clostridia bacterium]
MERKTGYEELLTLLDSHKTADKEWFLALLDDEKQAAYEKTRIRAVMQMLKIARIRPHKRKIEEAKAELEKIAKKGDPSAEEYRRSLELSALLDAETKKMNEYRPLFDEPYFARMDLVDPIEGYNSYYIGKKGDVKLEIVDWRAPVSKRYYQKSCSSFTFNEYVYKTVLRRALRTKNGQVEDFKNEYLSLKDYLSEEEIGGKDEENILDPFLKEIIKTRKEEDSVKDIIRTIQEKQYEIITCDETKNFVLQGCAGSGKTMVMLHRLSYLMYNHDDVRPHDVLIITPSTSFNAFIDELAAVLELERVRTLTVYDYFLEVLKNEKIDIKEKIDETQKESEEYLAYLYSDAFVKDLAKKQAKVYDSLFGTFTGSECKEFIEDILKSCASQLSAYETIKNSSLRVRRAVLGEIKEREEGGLYYTKPFRELMNGVLEVQEFFKEILKSERAKTPAYFYRQLTVFYQAADFVARRAERIVVEAVKSLEELAAALEKEVLDLRRFKQKIGDETVYLYADRIERRLELIEETKKERAQVQLIGARAELFAEFYAYLRGEKNFTALGGCADFVDVVRYFYKETVKKQKKKFGLNGKRMYPSDAYALCAVCRSLGKRLTPAHSFVFVDEAQDISRGEYELIRAINKNACFNLFGDVAQNVTPWRGIGEWQTAFPEFDIFTLDQNYRNTNQIVDFVASTLKVDMRPIGFDGPEVESISPAGLSKFFKEKKGLKALICSASEKEKYFRKAYQDVGAKKKISKTKINLLTVYESKGLEFSAVAVAPEGMTDSERYIAYTRAMKDLAVIKAQITKKEN